MKLVYTIFLMAVSLSAKCQESGKDYTEVDSVEDKRLLKVFALAQVSDLFENAEDILGKTEKQIFEYQDRIFKSQTVAGPPDSTNSRGGGWKWYGKKGSELRDAKWIFWKELPEYESEANKALFPNHCRFVDIGEGILEFLISNQTNLSYQMNLFPKGVSSSETLQYMKKKYPTNAIQRNHSKATTHFRIIEYKQSFCSVTIMQIQKGTHRFK